MSPLPLDPNGSNNLVSQEIIEIKTLLVKVKGLLEKEASSEELNKDNHDSHDSPDERKLLEEQLDRKSTRLNSSHSQQSRMPSSA